MLIVVMGVSGSGKSTIGSLLARRLECAFADADDFHPANNLEKMESGKPLTDNDRDPWLYQLNRQLVEWWLKGQSGVLACSALKRKYAATLEHGLPQGSVRFVHLDGPPELLAERMNHRRNHFMPAKLLASQLAALEAPESALIVSIEPAPEQIVDRILNAL